MGNREHTIHLHYQDQLDDDVQENHRLLRESNKTNTLCGKMQYLNDKVGGTYSKHCALQG